MNNTLDWNLHPKEYKGVTIHQIQLISQATDFNDSKPFWRLLVLSHQIAHHGTPAFFLENPPSYCQNVVSKEPIVVVFDLEDTFKSFTAPYFFRLTNFTIRFSIDFFREMMEHIQRAMTLYLYYKYYSYNPFYHTSFLLFASTENWSEPFLMHYTPVKINKKLFFRVLLLGNLEIQIGSESHFYEKSIVLISPFEHPFYVMNSSPSQLSVKYVDQSIHTFERKEIKVTQVLKPVPSLYSIFDFPQISQQIHQHATHPNKLCQFKPTTQFPFSESELNDYYKSIAKKEKKTLEANSTIQNSTLRSKPVTIDVILTEQISDSTLRNIISDALRPLQIPAPKWLPLQIESARYATFFEINYGLTIMTPPPFAGYFTVKTSVNFTRIDVPNVLISKIHINTEIPANEVIRRWIPENLKPLLGPKNAHYVVFADNSIKEMTVKNFCSQLAHAYSLCSFGKLFPFPKISAHMFMNSNEICGSISTFLKEMPLTEYQEYPVIAFIINENDLHPSLSCTILATHFKPSQIMRANSNFFFQAAFLLYSRISIYMRSPLNAPPSDTPVFPTKVHAESIFFGFRYQPPFFLKRPNSNTLHVHCCWDPSKHISVWTDDTGSSLQTLHLKSVNDIAKIFQELRTMFSDINVTISLGIAYEGCTDALISPLTKRYTDVNVYTIFPTPFVQVTSQIDGDEDVFIESEYESMFEINPNSLQPLACGFVASKRFPSYYLALYFTSYRNGHKEALFSIAKNLSALSWLSVRPGAEWRVVGYPPPLNYLLQNIHSLYYMTNRFEFLPCIDNI